MAHEKTPNTDAGDSGRLTKPSYCPICGSDLSGRPQLGECPECGRKYRPGSVVARRAPSALSIVIRFIWPVAVFAAAMCTMQLVPYNQTSYANTTRDLLQLVASLSAIAFLINLPWQMVWWRRVRGLPSQESAVLRIAAIVLVSIVSAVCLLPFLAFGACLVLVAASR